MTSDEFFLLALAVFGIGFCVERFVPTSPALAAAVGIAAGVMGVFALVTLF